MNKLILLFLSAAVLIQADTLLLKNGQRIEGTYLGGDARTIKFDAADRITTYAVTEVEDVQFGSGTVASTMAPPPTAQPHRTVQISANTPVTVRLIDAIRSDAAAPGSLYRASTDSPVYWGGNLVIPAHSPAVVQLLDKADSGGLTGRASLSLALTKVILGGTKYDVQTTDTVETSGNRTGTSAKITGGTAAAGAILGAIAGGGRGAAIGAGSGAAVGATVSVLRPGQKINLSSETKLTFRLATPLTVTTP
jgi:hypothetical protein